jgi:anti-sigma regulatory factor (Ser/Thr protein kinase)
MIDNPRTPPLRHALPKSPIAAREARRFVTDQLARRFDERRAIELELVVSELTTNAVLHGDEPIDLHVSAGPRSVRIEIHDGSPMMPAIVEPSEHGGRGMRLVDRLADRWGAEADEGHGKQVWVEFDA